MGKVYADMGGKGVTILTLSAHAREGYSSHFVLLCHFFILEKAPLTKPQRALSEWK